MSEKKPPAGWRPEQHGIGVRMRALRIRYGVKTKDIAARLGIAPSEVLALERDKRAWDHGLIDAWVTACNRLRR